VLHKSAKVAVASTIYTAPPHCTPVDILNGWDAAFQTQIKRCGEALQ
jgi:hypothetical protein